MFTDLELFISTDPKIPDDNKEYTTTVVPEISVENSREEIIHEILGLAGKSELALLTLYTYRQMDMIDWLPFIKAAIERNPVCFNDLIQRELFRIFMKDLLLFLTSQYMMIKDWLFPMRSGISEEVMELKRHCCMADVIINRDKGAEVKIKIDHKEGYTGI